MKPLLADSPPSLLKFTAQQISLLALHTFPSHSLLFMPQLSPCGSPLAGCLSPPDEALLSLSLSGDGIGSTTRRWLGLQQARWLGLQQACWLGLRQARCDVVAVVSQSARDAAVAHKWLALGLRARSTSCAFMPRKVLCLWLGLTSFARNNRQEKKKDCMYSSLQGYDWPVVAPRSATAYVFLRSLFPIAVD